MPYQDFKRYPNRWFVETGSYYGDGIQAAIDAGFEHIRSMEVSLPFYSHCRSRFCDCEKDVQIILGDSSKDLWDCIQDIDEPITFWLDGHFSGDNTGYGEKKYPLLEELEQIQRHPIKTHTIIIDDVRLMGTEWNFRFVEVLDILDEINPEYRISLDHGYVEADVLIAKVEQDVL